MEFEEKDYEAARDCASQIQQNAEAIMNIFTDIDNSMRTLYGEAWQSTGADVSNGRYQVLRSNYEKFYERVTAMQKHVNTVTTRNETTDKAVGDNLAGV